MTTYVKIVKGATKIKVAAPKPKYIEPILIGTHNREDFRTIIDALSDRLGDTAWSVVYKSLLVLHIMIREGEPDVTLRYLSKHPRFLELEQIKSIKSGDSKSLLRYARYLSIKSKQFGSTGIDYVKDEQNRGSNKEGARLRDLSIDKGLLREVESVEKQISALLSCKFNENDINNDVVLTCFRMLVNDLLCLFQALNEGVINILEHYFEMSKYDAERALEIYKDFVVLTTDVVNYLRVAKHLEYATKLHVPTIKHAPVALAQSLEDYLHDEHFEANRSQYLAEKDYKSKSPIKPVQKQQVESSNTNLMVSASNPWSNQLQPLQIQFTQQQPTQLQPVQTQSVPQLQSQQTHNPFLQQQPLAQQPTAFLQPIQQAFTGVIPQQTSSVVIPQQTSNPFMQQQLQQQQLQLQQQQLQQQQTAMQPKPLESSKTGNNPFAIGYQQSQTPSSNPFAKTNTLSVQATGTNPFQNQTMTNANQNRFTFGGYEKLPTVPVFPETIKEQQTNQFNHNAGFQLQQQIDANKQQQFFQQQQQLQQQQQQPQQLSNGYLSNQFTGFQQQPQPQTFQSNNVYDGPSLI